jgi:hypothetical protein
MIGILLIPLILFTLSVCKDSPTKEEDPDIFQLLKVSAEDVTLSSSNTVTGISPEATFEISFTSPVDTTSAKSSVYLQDVNTDSPVPASFMFQKEAKTIVITPNQSLEYVREYRLVISDQLKSDQGAEFTGVEYLFETENGTLELISATVNGEDLMSSAEIREIEYDEVSLEFTFSEGLDDTDYRTYFNFSPSVLFDASLSNEGKTVTITNTEDLDYYRFHSVSVSSNLSSESGFSFAGFNKSFQTGLNDEDKFPRISDDQLLTKVQEATFGYFWDFGHPVSGLARERNSSGDVVTIGGSGFGLMVIIVGIERGFVTREEGIARLNKIITFLGEDADRFHGVWSHWLNGATGSAIAFSTRDDGADLVETAFMAQGLITVREYLDENNATEDDLITDINTLLDGIEWDWFTRDGQDVLYWHWSPNYGWDMNMQIKGYNEALIVYVLAKTSANHGIDADVYHKGWASSGGIMNGNSYYGITLPVGYPFGGPLFFAHYSFMGLDPRGLSDSYANYWTQNRNHSLINQQHSVENPGNYIGYSAESWGLTASDEPGGYSAHEPNRDNGTITPTAAVSSIPYSPEESMDAIRHFYYKLGDKLWGEYGFYDAFNPTEGWWADSYLAIDQGPIVVMIENDRTGLIWDLFMEAPEVQTALDELGFTISE